jgi:nucleoside-diphosphate-sugar epimerase
MVRLPEFYGPHVVTLTARVVRAALDGKRAVWPGKLDAPIELVYMPDGAAAMVEVGTAADAERKTFHVPGVRTTARGFAAAVYAAAGAGKPRVSSVPPWILRAVGIFDAGVRGAADIGHLWTHPVLLDGARYAARFGAVPVTPLEDGVAATVAWMRDAGAVRLQG